MEFILSQNNGDGTSLREYLLVVPADLIKVFGESGINDDPYKSVINFIFEAKNNPEIIFTLYDYKATTAYSSGCPYTPAQFIALKTRYNFHIGSIVAHDDYHINLFRKWVYATVARSKRNMYDEFNRIMQK